jgi:Ice-binding-like
MSNRFRLGRRRFAGLAVLMTLALAAIPVTAQASAVNLATAGPFVVLGGSAVTNTGPSVLNGELGVAPGTSLTGFGLPALVNGATHDNDAVAAQAQGDLTTAYGVAAGQPIPLGNDLTGTNLGSRSLTAGAYRFSSSAQLTGQLTLNAQGNPNAQFVFVIGSALTTASASSVILTNGASPCNVYWKVGSSATLGSTTAFVGNLMVLSDISLNNGVTVNGRVLARNGQISLINDVLHNDGCATGSSSTPSETGSGGGTTTPGKPKPKGAKATRKGTATLSRGKKGSAGVRATVRGKKIKKVVFTDNGARVGGSGHQVRVPVTPGVHVVVAHVTFTDSTPPRTLRFHFRVPAPVLHPRHGPSQFTG